MAVTLNTRGTRPENLMGVRFRETGERFEHLNERIAKLVSAIGGLIRSRPGMQP